MKKVRFLTPKCPNFQESFLGICFSKISKQVRFLTLKLSEFPKSANLYLPFSLLIDFDY